MKLLSHLLVFAIGIGLYIATAAPAAVIDTPPWQPTGKYIHPDIKESSGIVASRQFEGVYWTLNDSGNPATLYATKLNGELIQEIAVKGSRNFDWEALGIDDKNQLWIGEIGNNSRLRFDLKVVVVAEPDPFTEIGGGSHRELSVSVPRTKMWMRKGFLLLEVSLISSLKRENGRCFTGSQPCKFPIQNRY